MARWSLGRLLGGWAVLALAMAAVLSDLPHARAGDCPGRYTISQSSVLDNDTKLTWTRSELGNAMSQSLASTLCKQILVDNTSWRLPSRLELLTLVDETKLQPSIDTVAFPSAFAEGYWTQTADASLAGSFWSVTFLNGKTERIDGAMPRRVRCVH